jgi:hypothetical protein
MVNLQDLNKTISDFESEVKKFKSVAEVYSELAKLKAELAKLHSVSQEGAAKIKLISDKLEAKLVEYEKLLKNLEKSNRNFQKELEQHITSKLEKHKSDIQVEIRNEGLQIQRGFENSLNLNFNNLQLKLVELFGKQDKKLLMLKILLFVIITCSLGLGGLMIYLK